MIERRVRDLACMLGRTGVTVTLGAASTPASVHAADAEILQNATVAVVGRAVAAMIGAGLLPGLASGAPVTISGGPLAGAYVVDQVFAESDGAAQRFIAYPDRTAAPDLWARGAILLSWGRRFAGAGPGPAFDLRTIVGSPVLVLKVDADVRGTNPLLEIPVFQCETESGTYEASGLLFEPIEDLGSDQALALPGDLGPWIRLPPAISGEDDPSYLCGAVLLDVGMGG